MPIPLYPCDYGTGVPTGFHAYTWSADRAVCSRCGHTVEPERAEAAHSSAIQEQMMTLRGTSKHIFVEEIPHPLWKAEAQVGLLSAWYMLLDKADRYLVSSSLVQIGDPAYKIVFVRSGSPHGDPRNHDTFLVTLTINAQRLVPPEGAS